MELCVQFHNYFTLLNTISKFSLQSTQLEVQKMGKLNEKKEYG